jgi:hypothetical protein
MRAAGAGGFEVEVVLTGGEPSRIAVLVLEISASPFLTTRCIRSSKCQRSMTPLRCNREGEPPRTVTSRYRGSYH